MVGLMRQKKRSGQAEVEKSARQSAMEVFWRYWRAQRAGAVKRRVAPKKRAKPKH